MNLCVTFCYGREGGDWVRRWGGEGSVSDLTYRSGLNNLNKFKCLSPTIEWIPQEVWLNMLFSNIFDVGQGRKKSEFHVEKW